MSDSYSEYLAYIKQEEEAFNKQRKNEDNEKQITSDAIFTLADGFIGDFDTLIHYTQLGWIEWRYSRDSSYYDEDDKSFSIVFVSSAFCILEIRGTKKRDLLTYDGYLQRYKDTPFDKYDKWTQIYDHIISKSDYFKIENLLQKLKYKPRRLRETNWIKITRCITDSSKKFANYLNKKNYCVSTGYHPISYNAFLKKKYPENWHRCGMSGGGFSPK